MMGTAPLPTVRTAAGPRSWRRRHRHESRVAAHLEGWKWWCYHQYGSREVADRLAGAKNNENVASASQGGSSSASGSRIVASWLRAMQTSLRSVFAGGGKYGVRHDASVIVGRRKVIACSVTEKRHLRCILKWREVAAGPASRGHRHCCVEGFSWSGTTRMQSARVGKGERQVLDVPNNEIVVILNERRGSGRFYESKIVRRILKLHYSPWSNPDPPSCGSLRLRRLNRIRDIHDRSKIKSVETWGWDLNRVLTML